MLRVRQQFDRARIEDVSIGVRTARETVGRGKRIWGGRSVAVTAGGRGIATIPVGLQATCRFLKDLGAKPFLVPTMGSHGGGTAEGQRQVIESYGITESFVGA